MARRRNLFNLRLRLALAAAALGLSAATALALSARLYWWFDLATHFRPHYAVAALALLVVALAARARLSAALLAIVLALNAAWLGPLFGAGGGAAKARDDAGVRLRVVTLNMLDTNPNPRRVADFILASDADIVSVQEGRPWGMELPPDLSAAYPYSEPAQWRHAHSVALLSRRPLVAAEFIKAAVYEQHWAIQSIPLVVVDFGDAELTLVGVHPPRPVTRRLNDARHAQYVPAMIEVINSRDRPLVALGDFNTTPYSPYWDDLLAATGLRDAADGFGYLPTWPAALGVLGLPIDHVLVSPGVIVEDVRLGPDIGSDHRPLIVDIRVVPARDGRDASRLDETTPDGP